MCKGGYTTRGYTPMRIVKLLLVALVMALGLSLVTPTPASALDAAPYSDNRHWARSTGNQTLVFVALSSAFWGDYRQLFENSADDYSAASSLHVEVRTYCPESSNCLYFRYESGIQGNCGSSGIGHGNFTYYAGHTHIGAAVAGIDVRYCSLALAQYVVCNMMGRGLGLRTTDGFSPCSGGSQLHPSSGEVNTLAFLHAHTHPGTLYPLGLP